MIKIDIVSDTVCPWCFIGKRRLEQALANAPDSLDVRIAWRPFQLNPDMPEAGMERDEYLELKFGEKGGGSMYEAITDAARSTGLELSFDKIGRQPNTVLSHRLIGLAGKEGYQDAVVERLFNAYFMEGKDIGDVETLVDLAEEAGMDGNGVRAFLESDEEAEQVRAEDEMARRMGIQGVPCFIFNGKYAVSGAQEPDVFLQVFEMLRKEAASEDENANPEA